LNGAVAVAVVIAGIYMFKQGLSRRIYYGMVSQEEPVGVPTLRVQSEGDIGDAASGPIQQGGRLPARGEEKTRHGIIVDDDVLREARGRGDGGRNNAADDAGGGGACEG